MFHTKGVEKTKTHFMFNSFFFFSFFENLSFYEIIWKNVADAREATDGKVAHANCMLDTYGYKHTLKICNPYCLSTAIIVAKNATEG
jgi:hypothetical protein